MSLCQYQLISQCQELAWLSCTDVAEKISALVRAVRQFTYFHGTKQHGMRLTKASMYGSLLAFKESS
jgi:hypothetical protein